jgi:hypothetical protein
MTQKTREWLYLLVGIGVLLLLCYLGRFAVSFCINS